MKNKSKLLIVGMFIFGTTAITSGANDTIFNYVEAMANPGYRCCTSSLTYTDEDGFPERIDVTQCVEGTCNQKKIMIVLVSSLV